MKINLHKFTEFTFLLSLLLISNSGFAQNDKAQNKNINNVIKESALMVYIDEDFSGTTGTTPPPGWTQNVIEGVQGVDLWHFDNPGSRIFNFPVSSPAAIFDSYKISNNNLPENTALESPGFTIGGGAAVILELDHFFNAIGGGEIFIEAFNGNSWVSIFSSTATSPNPQHLTFDITPQVSGVTDAKVRFRWASTDGMYWIIDNITVYSADPPPDPAIPVSPADGALDVDINSGLSWESVNGAVPTGYRLYFGTDGGGVNIPTNIENNTDLQFAEEYMPDAPFVYNTTYYWMVIPYNASGDAQGVPIWSFTAMEDPPVTAYPYLEDFEGAFPPQYYIRYTGILEDPITVNATNSGWEHGDWRNSSSPVNRAAKLNISGNSLNNWFMTTLADLGQGTDYQLEFDLALNAAGTSDPPEPGGIDDRFVVIISTDSGKTWLESNILKEWNNTGSQYVYDEISSLGEHIVIDLSAYSGMIQLGFYGESSLTNADNDLMIDNLEIKKIIIPPVSSINPPGLDFGNVGVGNSRTLQAEVGNTGDEDLIISNIVSSSGEFTFTPSAFPIIITAGGSQTINITFTPSGTGTFTSSLIFTHNGIGSPIAYEIQGTGSDEGPTFVASPGSLNYGLVKINENKNLTVKVSNTGLLNELEISSVYIPDSGFTVIPTSANIPAGGNQIFTITFSPASAAVYSGNLIFASNDPSSPDTIPLTGKGVEESGLSFQRDTVYQLDDDVYTSAVQLKGLDPLGEKVQAMQFRLKINKSADDNTILTFINIKKGPGTAAESWVLEYNLFRGPITANGASLDSVYVLLYNLEQDGGLDPSVDYNDLLSIEYRIANLPALSDTVKSSLVISNASATTSSGYPVDITSVANIMSVMAVNRVSSRGDVNGDGYIDILDLIMIVDHIIGKDSLSGEYFKRADVSPWIQGMQEPEPDGIVNVQDLSLIQNIILTGFYPNNNPIKKTASGTIPKIAGNADAKIKAYLTGEGITLYLNSEVEIRGAQVEFGNIKKPAVFPSVITDLGKGYFVFSDSSFRSLLYDRLADQTIKKGEHFLADIPFRITNPLDVVPGRVVLVDADRHRMENVEVEVLYENAPDLPLDYVLSQNFPNPFNPSTSIQFQVPSSCYVTLRVYNMLGEEVRTLFARQVLRGMYQVEWDGSNNMGSRLSSGTYIYRLTAKGEGQNEFIKVRKMILLK